MQRKKTSEQRCHLQAHTRSACLSPSRPDNCSRVNAALCRCQHNKHAAACMGAHHLRYRISQKGGPGISSPASKACEGDLQQVDRACQGEAAVFGPCQACFQGSCKTGAQLLLHRAAVGCTEAAVWCSLQATGTTCGRRSAPQPETAQLHSSNSKPDAGQQRCALCSFMDSKSNLVQRQRSCAAAWLSHADLELAPCMRMMDERPAWPMAAWPSASRHKRCLI